MKFVARLAIAIATLISSAILCWGQNVHAQGYQQPTLAPPSSEGAWIGDDMADDGGAPDAMQPGGYADGYCGMDGCDGDGCLGSDECFLGPGPLGPGGAGGHGNQVPGRLWAEVHAHRRIWVAVDYLSYWTKGNPLPPLVTTSPLGTPQSQAGVLPVSATTEILFGGTRVDSDQRNGARINLGYWLIDGEFLGVEGGYFALQQGNTTFDAASNFSPGVPPVDQILARPFTNADPSLPAPQNDAALIAFPDFSLLGTQGQLSGAVDIRTTADMQGAYADFRKLCWIDFTSQRRLDLLLGYRFFGLGDSVTINDTSTFTATSGPLNDTVFTSQDVFSARNQFHGGEIGLKGQQYCGPFMLELIGKVAFGNNREQMYINGSNTLTTLGQTIVNTGGLLTQTSNIGQYQRDVFAILPEANVNLKFDITPNLRATLGYNFLYINRVQRSGSAIDTTVNPTQINGGTLVGTAQPAFVFSDTTFWAHGASGGIEYRW